MNIWFVVVIHCQCRKLLAQTNHSFPQHWLNRFVLINTSLHFSQEVRADALLFGRLQQQVRS